MKQGIAIVVAVCLLVSSCSALKINQTVDIPPVAPPTVMVSNHLDIDTVTITVKSIVSLKDANCLAKVIYYEARGEKKSGKVAVGYVVVNRTTDSRYPNTICGVVRQASYVNKQKLCQFSWYCNGGEKKLNAVISNPTYTLCLHTALAILLKTVDNNIEDAVSFHIRQLHNGNANGLRLVTTIGNHNFYERIHKDG